jgi:Family of unknown function (DUF6074)
MPSAPRAAKVLPFPLARRRDLVARQAAWFCEQTPEAAESRLRRLLDVQREVLVRKGVNAGRVDAECVALERAIRALAWRILAAHGGAA